jgi:hypothetical protein
MSDPQQTNDQRTITGLNQGTVIELGSVNARAGWPIVTAQAGELQPGWDG